MGKGGTWRRQAEATASQTMVYLNGLNFALRGGVEQRSLRAGLTSQLSIGTNEEGRYLCYRQEILKRIKEGYNTETIPPK